MRQCTPTENAAHIGNTTSSAIARLPAAAVAARPRAFAALAVGAVALGAMTIGALAIGRLAVGRARIKRLEIDELVVRTLRIAQAPQLPSQAGADRSG